jgi:hypothetical protein
MESEQLEQLKKQVQEPNAQANGATLEGFYKAASITGSCDSLFGEINKIPEPERLAALLSMSAINENQRKADAHIPPVKVESVAGQIQFRFPACDSKQ